MQNQDDKVEDLLNQALNFQPGEQAAFLAGACGNDQELRGQVETLLKAHAQADGFLPEATKAGSISEQPGTRIGRYKLLQKIGEGGMGVVYMAEQEEPVRRRVALKIIKLGMDTRSVVARFEAERQALALMDHPNIARVLDGGATETGRPFFVMELVQGVPITEFCDKNRLNAQARLKLFIQVCQAIQSAHQKGIIHRDIKPSNVLVTLHHGEPMPKVIDFGIAKATNQKLTEKTLFTQHATMIGTPAYMSPEQAEMSSMDVDTRADIYSLGVLLYELLTGSTPFPAVRLLSLAYGEMQRVIMEEEPERPSTRLGTLEKEQKTAVARNHGQELASLCNLLRGDLDWVVMKCLEKDRTRRYETANGLASDLKRHLENEPVIARPPSPIYRFQKAIRRNKLIFAAVGAVAAVLLLGIGASTWLFLRERAASKRAQAAEKEQVRQRTQADQLRANEAAARRSAEEAQGRAAAERQVAVVAREKEAEHRLQAEARAYAADINLAQRALARHNFAGARQFLERYSPQPGATNRPGWEWRYLWRQARSDSLFKVAQMDEMPCSLAVSHDEKRMVIGLLEGGLSVFDIENLRAPREITKLEMGALALVSASPRESLLAYSSVKFLPGDAVQSTIALWDLEGRQVVATAVAENSLCSALTFFPDGKSVAFLMLNTADDKRGTGRLEIWKATEFQKVASYELPARAFYAGRRIAVGPDQSTIAVAADELRILDVATGTVRWSSKTDAGCEFHSVAISPDGRTLFSSETTKVPLIRIWDINSGKETGPRLSDHNSQINSLILSPDGETLASASLDQTIRVWDVRDPAKAKAVGRPLQGSKSGFASLVSLTKTKTVLSGSSDGSIYAWDISAVRSNSNPVSLSKVEWFDFDSAGATLYSVDQTGEVSRRKSTELQTTESLFNVGKDHDDLCLSPDSRLLAVGSTNGVFEVWDLPQKKFLGRFGSYRKWVSPHTFSPDNKRLVVWDEVNRVFCEWELSTMSQTRTYGPRDQSQRAVLTDDLRLVLSSSYRGSFSVEDLSNNRKVTHDLDIRNVTSINTSRDGKRFAATSFLGNTGVWETDTLRPLAMVGDRSGPVYSASFSPDGTRLVTGAVGSGPLILWDLATQMELLEFQSPSGHRYFRGKFSPDGSVLAAQTSETLELWRAPTSEEIEQTEAEIRQSATR